MEPGLLQRIATLVASGNFLVSSHGDDEMAADTISVHDVVAGIHAAETIAEYPDYQRGPCVLVLQRDSSANPIHIVRGIPRGATRPAVLVTGYRPDPEKWDTTFTRRAR